MEKKENSKIVDFYFANSLDEITSLKDIFETNNIPYKIIKSNNNHPYFGTNSMLGMEHNLYDYIIQIPEEYITNAENLISEISPEVQKSEVEEVTAVEKQESGKITKSSFNIGYYVLLLFFTHYSRFFLSVSKIDSKNKKRKYLNAAGIIYMILNFSMIYLLSEQLFGDFVMGLYFSALGIFAAQTILNFIDFIIERNKLQKYLFIVFGIILAVLIALFNTMMYL